jgi:hypothetical protein
MVRTACRGVAHPRAGATAAVVHDGDVAARVPSPITAATAAISASPVIATAYGTHDSMLVELLDAYSRLRVIHTTDPDQEMFRR